MRKLSTEKQAGRQRKSKKMRLESLPANSGTYVTFPKLGQGHLHKVSFYSQDITGLTQIWSGGGEGPFINDNSSRKRRGLGKKMKNDDMMTREGGE